LDDDNYHTNVRDKPEKGLWCLSVTLLWDRIYTTFFFIELSFIRHSQDPCLAWTATLVEMSPAILHAPYSLGITFSSFKSQIKSRAINQYARRDLALQIVFAVVFAAVLFRATRA